MTVSASRAKRTSIVTGPGASTASERRLHVLHVISGLGPGGAEAVLYRLATRSAHEHMVICLGPPDWYSGLLERSGIPVHHVDCTSVRAALANARALHRLIRSSDPDIVQGWMYRGNIFGGISGRLLGKPVIWNIRCSTLEPLRIATRFLAYAGAYLVRFVPDLIINCSARSAEFHDSLGYTAVETVIIPNGYDSARFQPDTREMLAIRESVGAKPGTFLVGSIGRWHAQKGYPILLDAVQLLRRRGVPVRLLLAGTGLDSENAELAELIRSRGLERDVATLGHLADIAPIAGALDLHVLASVGAEGFPNIVAETMLCGTPNVATDVGDSAVIVGDCGWIIPPADPERLAAAIAQAHAERDFDSAGWLERRNRARERICKHFSIQRMVSAYEDVWRDFAMSER